MVKDPQSLDTIVATNLHTDILLDLAGALAASLKHSTFNLKHAWPGADVALSRAKACLRDGVPTEMTATLWSSFEGTPQENA